MRQVICPVKATDDSSPQLDLGTRRHVLDLCRILYAEKDSYMVTLKLPPRKKRLAVHNFGKVFMICLSRSHAGQNRHSI